MIQKPEQNSNPHGPVKIAESVQQPSGVVYDLYGWPDSFRRASALVIRCSGELHLGGRRLYVEVGEHLICPADALPSKPYRKDFWSPLAAFLILSFTLMLYRTLLGV